VRLPLLPFIAWLGLAVPVLPAAEAPTERISEKRVESLFRPSSGERTALSPDGKFMAYTQHIPGELLIIVLDLERRVVTARISADEDRPILHSKEKRRARLRYLEWADERRLVFAPDIEVIGPPVKAPSPDVFLLSSAEEGGTRYQMPPLEPTVIAPIMAVDADGKNPLLLADPKTFQTMRNDPGAADIPVRMRTVPPVIRGFAAGDRAHLLVEIQGLVTYGPAAENIPTVLYRVHVRTGKITEAHSEPGTGRIAYDLNGRPRLARERTAGLGSTFLFRASESGRWLKLPEPPGADPTAGFTVIPGNYFGERAIPLGFDADPDVMIYASNVGRDTFGVYGFNLKTRTRTALSLEHPARDLVALDMTAAEDALIFDRHRNTFAGVRVPGSLPLTVWVDAELGGVQRAAEAKFPSRSVELRDWNEARTHFLVQVTGGGDPGRTFQFQRAEDLMIELMRSARWLPNAELHETRAIEFAGPEGSKLTGFLTLPRAPRLSPTPLVVWFAPGLPPRPHAEFDAQAQVLADMGFVVCRLNQRGVSGYGARARDALRRDPDGAPAADALAAIEWIAARHRIDRKRVATMGEGLAGYFALRTAQVQPQAFRCAVVFEPVLNVASLVQPPPDVSSRPTFAREVNRVFLEGRGAKVRELSVSAHADELTAAVFVALRGDRFSDADATTAAGVAHLRSQLARRDVPCVTVEFNTDFVQGLPAARARLYRELEEFFNLHLYNYDVKIGPTRVVR
jgi:dienelactone hydrolase